MMYRDMKNTVVWEHVIAACSFFFCFLAEAGIMKGNTYKLLYAGCHFDIY